MTKNFIFTIILYHAIRKVYLTCIIFQIDINLSYKCTFYRIFIENVFSTTCFTCKIDLLKAINFFHSLFNHKVTLFYTNNYFQYEILRSQENYAGFEKTRMFKYLPCSPNYFLGSQKIRLFFEQTFFKQAIILNHKFWSRQRGNDNNHPMSTIVKRHLFQTWISLLITLSVKIYFNLFYREAFFKARILFDIFFG